ncbi:MAG: tandem-95 repeat protein, partial [Planctomycetes bacterium]|nr:tandem-95 repeat protein [Planctomycetota bacterium]
NASTGAFTYTPSADANGADLFTFKAFDGQAYSNVSTVSITIGAVNDKPVAEADALTTDEDTPYTGGLSGSDVENQPLTFSIVSIHAVNDTPTSQSGTVGTPEDTPFNGTLSASDVENDGLAYTLVANGSKGTAAITNSATGAFTYTPNTNANGSDSFTFKVNDGSADSNTATVTVNISPVNDIPMASIPAPGPYSVPEGVAFAFAGSGIDIEDGSNLTYEWDWDDSTPNGLAQNPSHLWNAPGTYTVSLVVTDQEGMPSNPVSVKVTVTPKAGERDLYLKKGKFSTDWKAHNDGIEKDTFFVQGCLNPAGCNANLNGATFELSVEGISLGVVPLAKNGKGSAGIGHAIAKASL